MNGPVPIAIELLAATHLDHQWWKASGGRPGRRLQDGGAQGKMNATTKKVLVDSDQEQIRVTGRRWHRRRLQEEAPRIDTGNVTIPQESMVCTPKATNTVAEAGGSSSELTMRLTRNRFETLDRFPMNRKAQFRRGSSPASATTAYCNDALGLSAATERSILKRRNTTSSNFALSAARNAVRCLARAV